MDIQSEPRSQMQPLPQPTLKVRLLTPICHFTLPNRTPAFFEKSPEGPLIVLSRSSFEARLKNQPGASTSVDTDDPAWWAIRNTVYAAGCRMLLARLEYSSTFAEAQSESWKYFKNALSVLPDLLHPRFDLEGIRALLLMVSLTVSVLGGHKLTTD